MGRESGDSIVIQSSIALLQERFKQLQRMKEMREERELLRKKFHSPETKPQYEAMITGDYEPTARFFFHFLPQKSPPGPLSDLLSHDSKSSMGSMDGTPILMSFLPVKSHVQEVSSFKFETCSDSGDIDTSLHL